MTAALELEASLYGDLVVMEISQGMNFGLKLVSAMRWMYERYSFSFFLRLDDDYFLCLKHLLDELLEGLAQVFGVHQYPSSFEFPVIIPPAIICSY